MFLSLMQQIIEKISGYDYQNKIEKYIKLHHPESAAEIDSLINEFIKKDGQSKWFY